MCFRDVKVGLKDALLYQILISDITLAKNYVFSSTQPPPK